MASPLHLIPLSLLIFISLSQSHRFQPKSLLLPISKHPSTLQYITNISLGTPPLPTTLVIDLGGQYLWKDCNSKNKSSTYQPARCGSAPCSVAKAEGCGQCSSSPNPACNNKTCGLFPENTITRTVHFEEVAVDNVLIQSRVNGSKSSPVAMVPSFIFCCAETSLLDGLADGVKGMVGLGRTQIGLPTQLSSAFHQSLPKKFALCLPSTSKSDGVVFFGSATYVFFPFYNQTKRVDVSERFAYTKLYINPVSTAGSYVHGEPSVEYFVGVKSITINGKPIALNTSLLSFNKKGVGGTKISTVNPYSVLQSSIYEALTDSFAKELVAENVTRVAAVTPFTDCFSTKSPFSYTPLGPGVPKIGFVFEGKNVEWVVHGGNSMVEVSSDVVCLGFVDGGLNPRTAIVIGAHQLEDNLLQFDLAASKLAFTSTLLLAAIGCTNFNF